jgi:hypothetical protein
MLEVTTSEKISDENLLNFGSLLEHVTTLYSVRAVKHPLPEQVIPAILKLIASKNLLYSLLGNRILHNLIDRCNNKLKFDSPRIFFRNSHYNIVLNNYNSMDKLLFQRYRELLHKTFVESVIKHGVHKYAVELCQICRDGHFSGSTWKTSTFRSSCFWWRYRAGTPQRLESAWRWRYRRRLSPAGTSK